MYFIIQDFLANCCCPENRVCPKIFQGRGGGRPPRTPASYAYARTTSGTRSSSGCYESNYHFFHKNLDSQLSGLRIGLCSCV